MMRVSLPGENVTRLTTDGYQQVWVFFSRNLGVGRFGTRLHELEELSEK